MAGADAVKEQILQRADIAEIVSQYVHLQNRGGRLFGLCPFHKEKTPSFSVRPDTGYYHCFGCGAGGNVIDFVMGVENLTYPEARRYLAGRLNIEIPETRGPRRPHSEIDRYDVMEAAANFYQKWLFADRHAMEYLQRRGLSREAIQNFSLGYAPNEWESLLFALKKQGIPETVMEELGLILASNKGKGHYDRFRHRVMFPIRNTIGRVIAFGGRALDPNDRAKYLNSNETPLFNKSKSLYLLDKAKTVVKDRGALVVEGYMDAISLHVHGFNQTVATLGTSLTGDHVHMLRRYTNRYILLYDGDSAGVRAALRGVELFFEQGLAVRAALLPEGKDPDDLLRESGPDEMKRLLDGAVDGFDFTLNHALRGNDLATPQGKSAVVEGMTPLIARVPDAYLRTDYVRLLAERIGADFAALQETIAKKMKKTPGRGGDEPAAEVNTQTAASQDPLRKEKEILIRLLAMHHGFCLPEGLAAAERPWLFTSEEWGEILPGYLTAFTAGAPLDRVLETLLKEKPEPGAAARAARLDELFPQREDRALLVRVIEAETLPGLERDLKKMKDDVLAGFQDAKEKRRWDALRLQSKNDPRKALEELNRTLFQQPGGNV